MLEMGEFRVHQTYSCHLPRVVNYCHMKMLISSYCVSEVLWSCAFGICRHSHYFIGESSRAGWSKCSAVFGRSFQDTVNFLLFFFFSLHFHFSAFSSFFFAFVFVAILIHEVSIRLTWMTQELMCWLMVYCATLVRKLMMLETIFAMKWNSIYTLNFISMRNRTCDGLNKKMNQIKNEKQVNQNVVMHLFGNT